MDFGIAAAAMGMQQAQLSQAVSVSLIKKTMDSAEQQATGLLEMLPQQPPSTHNIDVYA